MITIALFLFYILKFAHSLSSTSALTFYGDSYHYVPREGGDTSLITNTTTITFRFLSVKHSTLLLSLKGEQSINIWLQKGRIHVIYRVGSYKIIDVWSPHTLTSFADGEWHRLRWTRRSEEFQLLLDQTTIAFVDTAYKNVKSSQSAESELYFGRLGDEDTEEGLVGCIADVSLQANPINLKGHPGSISYRTLPGCDSIFSNNSYPSWKLRSSSSFLAFALNPLRSLSFLTIHFEVRTLVQDAVLLHLAPATITLHISQGHLLLTTDKYTTAESQLSVSNGKWHRVGLRWDGDSEWEISVDTFNQKLQVPVKQPMHVAMLLIGNKIDTRHNSANLMTSDLGGIMCLHDIFFQFNRLLMQNITIIRDVQSGCALKNPCLTNSCPNNMKCIAYGDGVRDYRCQCTNSHSCIQTLADVQAYQSSDTRFTTRENYDDLGDVSLYPVHVQNPIVVSEGNSTRLDSKYLYVFPQHSRYGLTDTNILFRLIDQPKHGKLTVAHSNSHDLVRHSFTYADVLQGRVNYTHDATETLTDSLELEVEFRNLNSDAPESLHRRFTYSVLMEIQPVNDAPRLSFPQGLVFRMAQNSRMLIKQDRILLTDPDDYPQNVKVKVLYATPGGGYFHYKNSPSQPLTIFTQEDINNKIVYLKHYGPLQGQLTIAAVDLQTESEPENLSIRAFEVHLQLINNTGIKVLHRSEQVIANSNLSMSTNAGDDQVIDVYFIIVKIPSHGFIEVEDDAGHWWITSTFNQSQINAGRVRYRHSKDDIPSSDMFKFKVSALNTTSLIIYDFKIGFVPVNIKVFSPNMFVLNNTRKGFLSREHLFAWTFPRSSSPEYLVYHVTKAPTQGFLMKIVDKDTNRNRRLGLYSNFTQADIDNGILFYQLHFAHYKLLYDQFTFKVVAPLVSSEEMSFDLTFVPGAEEMKLINRTLVLKEGDLKKIHNTTLYLETPDNKHFIFSIAVAPSHGELHLLDPRTVGTNELKQGDNFTSTDIHRGLLLYRHDDSETVSDSCMLVASSHHARIPFWMHMQIILVNDHVPERASFNQLFYITVKGEKLVTESDLRFLDQDSDMDSLNLRYFFTPQPQQGAFLWQRLQDIPTNNFTQKDINEGKILFRHYGEEGEFAIEFIVTDGKKSTNKQIFRVNASTPFLRPRINGGLVVERGGIGIVGPLNLSMETNLNLDPSQILFRLIKPPSLGKLILMIDDNTEGEAKETEVVMQEDIFSQRDIIKYKLLYSHQISPDERDPPAHEDDFVSFFVQAGHLEIFLKVQVLVVSEKKQALLIMQTLNDLTVTDGGVAQIEATHLKANHPHYMPASVRYTVVEAPQYGNLVLESPISATTVIDTSNKYSGIITHSNFYVHQFTQFDVNSGALQYLHSGTSGTKQDQLVVNITAGEDQIGPITLKINVVQNQVILQVSNITVFVGSRTVLDKRILQATSTFYDSPAFVYQLIEPPVHGQIRNISDTELDTFSISTFSGDDVLRGYIYYVHDGETSWEDQFNIVVSLKQFPHIQSQPQFVHVRIKHENLQAPEQSRKNALEMWDSRVATITRSVLQYMDMDSPAEDIRFVVTSPSNGYIALREDPTKAIYNFTQADIDQERVVFVRDANGTSGGFSFVVTDGVHQLAPTWFSIEAIEYSLTLQTNSRLVVAPGTDTFIDKNLLNAKAVGADNDKVVYTISRKTKYGTILVNGKESAKFTQKDIDEKRVSYIQDVPIENWVVKDTFFFTISLNTSGQFHEDEQKFKIVVSYANVPPEHLSNYIYRSPVVVQEGASLAINSSHLNISKLAKITHEDLLLRVTNIPEHGWLQFREDNVSHVSQASARKDGYVQLKQSDLDHHLLVYHHHMVKDQAMFSDDILKFQVFPSSQSFSRKKALHLSFSLTVRILPINNKKFAIQRAPSEIKVVRSSYKVLTIEDFLTEDEDTAASSIVYDIVQESKVGYFAVGQANSPVKQFSQADINKKLIRFVQDGPLNEGAFTFRVSDGTFQPITKVVRVLVQRLTLTFISRRISYKQGLNHFTLNRSHLGADSNGLRESIIYEITRPPENGTFLLAGKDTIANRFTQADIDSERITYTAINIEAWKDEFTVQVSNSQNHHQRNITIFVDPAITVKKPTVAPGDSLVLSKDLMDVTELEDKSPRFLVTKQPIYGSLEWVPFLSDQEHQGELRSRRESIISYRNPTVPPIPQSDYGRGRENPVTAFTYDDIKLKVVRYVSLEFSGLTDSFEYELRANGVQPARANFTIDIMSHGDSTMTIYGTTRGLDILNGAMITTTPISKIPTLPAIEHSSFILIAVIVGIIFVALSFIIIRRMRVRKLRERRQRDLKEPLESSSPKIFTSQFLDPPDLLGSTVYATVRHPSRATSIARTPPTSYHNHNGVNAMMSRSLTLDTPLSVSQSHSKSSFVNPPNVNAMSVPNGANANRLITFDPGRTQLVTSVPTCKVTPLTPRMGGCIPMSGSASSADDPKLIYQYSSSNSDNELKTERTSLDRATGYKFKRSKSGGISSTNTSGSGGDTVGTATATKLKDNQYWV